MSSEIDIEPIPGLPHTLPPGEHILWQGRPQWRGLLRHTFHVRWLVAYSSVLSAIRGVVALQHGSSAASAVLASAAVLPLAALCIAVLALIAWLNARATVYTITTKRVVMRFGVAFPMTFNLPYKRLAAASVNLLGGGGDIALQLLPPDRIAWLHLWPHARPWRFARAQPMLRALPDATRVAELLAEAVRSWSLTDGTPIFVASGAAAEEEAQPASDSLPSRAPETFVLDRALPAEVAR